MNDLRDEENKPQPQEAGRISPAGYLALHGLYNWNFVLRRIAFDVDQAAAEAQREIKAMGESARRSIGQMTRRDHFWRRAGSIYHVLYLKSLAERLK